MSDSVRPHRRQPTRLPRPWDSPGKNAGVGCHFLLQCMKVKSESEGAQSCPTLSDPIDGSPPGSPVHGIFQARVLEWGAIGEKQIKTMKYHFTPIRNSYYKEKNKNKSTKCWWGCREIRTLVHCWWDCKMERPLWKCIQWFLKNFK